ncbi:MAG: hypothetical protein AAFV29_22125, partial [Myxococcota bacterium]
MVNGTRAFGALCERDGQCASGRCVLAGDGGHRSPTGQSFAARQTHTASDKQSSFCGVVSPRPPQA